MALPGDCPVKQSSKRDPLRGKRSGEKKKKEQSMDQVGFRRGTGIDHALAVFETVCGKSIEWNCEIWFASLDLTKAFDRVEHNQLFQALREQHVPQLKRALT